MKSNGNSDDLMRFLVHNSDQVSAAKVKYAEELNAYPGLRWYSVWDKIVSPLRKGDSYYILARPSMSKTTLTAYLALQQAKAIQRGELDCLGLANPVILYVTFEQTVEDMAIIMSGNQKFSSTEVFRGKADLDLVRRKSVEDEGLPMMLIGNSHRHFGTPGQPRLNVDALFDVIWTLVNQYRVNPQVIYLDYLQRINPSGVSWRDDRSVAVAAVVDEIEQLKKEMGIPIVITAQAGRQVDNYDIPLPEMGDPQYSSTVEQTTGIMGSIMRPARVTKWSDPMLETTITIDSKVYKNDPWLFVYKILKDRHGVGAGTAVLSFKPHQMLMSEDLVKPINLIDVNDYNSLPPVKKNGNLKF